MGTPRQTDWTMDPEWPVAALVRSRLASQVPAQCALMVSEMDPHPADSPGPCPTSLTHHGNAPFSQLATSQGVGCKSGTPMGQSPSTAPQPGQPLPSQGVFGPWQLPGKHLSPAPPGGVWLWGTRTAAGEEGQVFLWVSFATLRLPGQPSVIKLKQNMQQMEPSPGGPEVERIS